jgi:type I restriction enzyme R subunit
LSDRRNIVVIADEAHRSQYGFGERVDRRTGERSFGFAQHVRDALPNASFIGFTGTPVELTDKNTRAVFGDYISVYDIKKAVSDGATVPIFYESRLAKLALKDSARPHLDPDFEEATEGEEVERKERLKSKWAQLEAVVGAGPRLKLIAKDLLAHFDARTQVMDGKAMIVCMSRRICVELYKELVALRPEWDGGDDDARGALKVVMTGSASDDLAWQTHIRSKPRREALAKRFREPKDPFKVVIVRDMWLTGFDAPCLHTMYVDKPMRGHGLMQTIARVNRVFKDKPGGLVVDYLGLADELKSALRTYTESGGEGETALDQAEAVAVMLEKHEVCVGMFHGFDRSRWTTGTPGTALAAARRAGAHPCPGGRQGALAAGRLRAFEGLRAGGPPRGGAAHPGRRRVLPSRPRGLDEARGGRGEVRRGPRPRHPADRLASARLRRGDRRLRRGGPEEARHLDPVRRVLGRGPDLPHRNLAVELLQKLLRGEIKARAKHNVVQARSFGELLDQTVRRYTNRAIETAQVIEELIGLAKDLRAAEARGESLGLNSDELAFYDALETNDSAVKVLGEPTLKSIARELVDTVRKNVTIDWTVRENVRAQLRVLVKRVLRKYGYPPDKQERATQTVMEQAAIERKHFKLWLTSVAVLERVLHAGIFSDSASHLERVRQRLARYVPNPSLDRAQALLEKSHFCIVAGIPGIGKTTLAEVLLADLVDRHGFAAFRIAHDLSELRSIKNPKSKQVFYFDDFLGKTALDKLQKNEDQRLVELMEEVSANTTGGSS